ncbi:hypothetical protein [Pseudomonas mosselii]|uniref:hypothetical protein n=1 Tax=Pseudomonas mosselii TaxID=78327 RepID=UPI00244B0F05|nr:hypothetical protein [Pseudomonas mosselii]MDH1529157.1 hypothetical protein [Pseudomonas mosselii]
MEDQNRDDELHAMRIRKLQADIADTTRLCIAVRFLHLSALSPVSRPSHMARHGELYTGEEMLEWWAAGDNRRSCRCACTPVLVDADGKPLTPEIVERAKAKLES